MLSRIAPGIGLPAVQRVCGMRRGATVLVPGRESTGFSSQSIPETIEARIWLLNQVFEADAFILRPLMNKQLKSV
jgi:hypothetical protein